ncbi:MAG TPA: 30S ribosomal protein S1 [Phycisphaerae bacterium]|nr:30S ribosomal protein S1 [Phycisphaerae bacterium]HRY68558.1 30S ribosomal protein S1 [Phycisphaerae bacterium]HSA25606.1 30S ribosomal protein S1 [Phycisphaerae bacterium]
MVDYNLIHSLELDNSIEQQMIDALGSGEPNQETIASVIDATVGSFQPGTLLKGRIAGLVGDDVIIDVGLKSEGLVPASEWDDKSAIDIGDAVDVWLESVESDSGLVVISKRKADRLLNWQRLVETAHEGDDVRGRVMRKIKGGLLVDIGVPVFLPASQVDIRRPGDIGEFIGREIDAKILKIDTERRNIVISRRKFIEEQRQTAKERVLNDIKIGDVRKGIVKNLADFGAFVDLGGIDGLLHITDMSWDRVNHPSDLLRIDQEVEIKVLNVDREKEKIALGLKQLTPNPWENIETRYPVMSRHKGEVVNITNYGAFVKLEPGVEGLVHISEMSWTRRINHPSEIVNLSDEVEVVVLEINKDKQEISLGMKQIESNPWTSVAQKYPPNTIIEGKVRNLANYGAFIEIEEGIDGLLHVSDMSWTKKISHPSEVLKKGDTVRCVVLSVDQEKMRVALGTKQLSEDPWIQAIPKTYIPGQIVKGKVTKITNFGVFVELETDLEGLLHVSELADHKVEDPHDEVKVGAEIEVKILRVDPQERKIGLSKKRAEWATEEGTSRSGEPKLRRGGLHGPGQASTDVITNFPFRTPEENPNKDVES